MQARTAQLERVVFCSPYYVYTDRVELTDANTLLSLALRRADEVTQLGEDSLAVKWRIKCVALARLVYGDGHWRLGQAHCQLARAYLELRGQSKGSLVPSPYFPLRTKVGMEIGIGY